MNFNGNGESILKRLAKDERMIDYNGLFCFFKTSNPIIKNFGF